MILSIFGLGYVGTVIAGCFAKGGHRVIGVDTETTKVAMINEGRSPIIEAEIEDIIREQVAFGNLRATTSAAEAVANSDVSLLCVGTPSQLSGELDLRFIRRVCEEIGGALRAKTTRHLIAVRSTVLPGTIDQVVIPTLEAASGLRAEVDFGVVMNPEFMREGTAVRDFYNPPKTVIGAAKEADAQQLAELYAGLPGPLILTQTRVAEMVKYCDNVFHALKITFGNEIGLLCKSLGIDSHEVMQIFCQDTKLNLSPAYLRPGFAYGGSCLPKDLRAITWMARARDVDVPVLAAIAPSNESQIRNAIRLITTDGRKRIGVLGFAFKGGTDDLRESPVVTLAEVLLGKGYELKLYDPSVNTARLFGANRRYIEQHIPHLARLMVSSAKEAVAEVDLILLGNYNAESFAVLPTLKEGQRIIDLTATTQRPQTAAAYERISG